MSTNQNPDYHSPERIEAILGKVPRGPVNVGKSPVEIALGGASLDLSSRPRRKLVMDQPVCVPDLAEAASILVDLLSQMPMEKQPGVGIQHAEALRYARHLADVLIRERSRGAQVLNDEVDALARESLKRQGGDAPKIVSASDADLAGKASSWMARTGDVVLDKSMDPQRWAEACAESVESNLTPGRYVPTLAEFFGRALGAGIAAGRVRERGAMIEEMAPVFRNLEILDMWADRMNVKGGERGLPLHQDPDARRWAREFIETVDTLEQKAGHKLCDPATFDEGWLLSWFANAMMASYDWAMRQRDQADAARKRMRTAHVFGPLLLTTALQAAGAPLWDSVCSRTEKGETFKGLAIRIQPWKRENGKAAPQLAVVVAWKKRTGPSLWARIVGKSRLLYGFCPACNSDAPEVDRCEVCLGYRSAEGVCEFPPSDARKAVWRKRWMEGKGVRPLQGEASCSPESNDCAQPISGSIPSDPAQLLKIVVPDLPHNLRDAVLATEAEVRSEFAHERHCPGAYDAALKSVFGPLVLDAAELRSKQAGSAGDHVLVSHVQSNLRVAIVKFFGHAEAAFAFKKPDKPVEIVGSHGVDSEVEKQESQPAEDLRS